MFFLLNPDAKEFIPQAGRVHHHSRERHVENRESGEAGHSVGLHAQQEGLECRRWLGWLHPANGNQGAYRATYRRVTFVIRREEKYSRGAKKEAGTSLMSAGK